MKYEWKYISDSAARGARPALRAHGSINPPLRLDQLPQPSKTMEYYFKISKDQIRIYVK